MPVETPKGIWDLVPEWPQGSDDRSAGDDHIRLIKASLQATFPAIAAPLAGSADQINRVTTQVRHIITPEDDATGAPPQYFSVTNEDGSAPVPMMGGSMDLAFAAGAGKGMFVNWETVMNIIMPIGHILATKKEGNPFDWLGFGTWIALPGYLLGAGTFADMHGYTLTRPLGYHPGYLRVQSGHIVYHEPGVTVDYAGEHTHTFAGQYNSDDAENDGTGAPMWFPTQQSTDWAGGHVHTACAHIGAGGLTDGAEFAPPAQAVYLWERITPPEEG